jgi:hypothetical protein
MGLYLPFLQHCKLAFSNNQYAKHRKHEKQVKPGPRMKSPWATERHKSTHNWR